MRWMGISRGLPSKCDRLEGFGKHKNSVIRFRPSRGPTRDAVNVSCYLSYGHRARDCFLIFIKCYGFDGYIEIHLS